MFLLKDVYNFWEFLFRSPYEQHAFAHERSWLDFEFFEILKCLALFIPINVDENCLEVSTEFGYIFISKGFDFVCPELVGILLGLFGRLNWERLNVFLLFEESLHFVKEMHSILDYYGYFLVGCLPVN